MPPQIQNNFGGSMALATLI